MPIYRFKRCAVSAAFVLLGARAFAYNPPLWGENLFRNGHADLTSQAASAAGGAFFSSTPQSIAVNPALMSPVQRVSVDAGYTGVFFDGGSGSGLQAGLALPSRWGVASFALQGVFMDDAGLGNTFTARAAFSKDVTDKLYVGAGVFGGAGNVGWTAGADAGFVYRLGALGALSDARIGAALTNLGITYLSEDAPGISGWESGRFPGMFTPRAGFAAVFLDTAGVDAAFSADLSLPFWQNAVFEAGLQARIADIIVIAAGWQLNALEAAESVASLMPSVGVSVKFRVNTGRSEFMSSKGWDTSDFVTSGAWRQLKIYGDESAQQISAGITANFGLRDTEGPAIGVWEDSK